MNDIADIATRRIGTRVYCVRWYRLIHALRCLIAGDVAPLLGTYSSGYGQQRITGMDQPYEDDRQFSELYDIFVTNLQEGRSNDLIKAANTLRMQVAFTYPDISIEDGEKIESMAIQAYLAKRLGHKPVGCGAAEHMKKSFQDYLAAGIGWSQIAIDEYGKPIIQYLDVLDVVHDLSTEMPQDLRWYAHICRKTVGYWALLYGEKHFESELRSPGGADRPLALTYYYDIDGESGHYAVFKGEQPGSGDVIDSGPNPFYTIIDGVRRPFLNADPTVFMILPSVRYPVGIMQKMVPHQMAVWASESYMRSILERGAPTWQVLEGAMSEKQLQTFKDGDIGSVIEVKQLNGIARTEALDIPQAVSIYAQYNRDEINAASGVDPFASGDSSQTYDFASEVNAIAARSDLTSHHMTKDHCAHWERTLRKFIATAALYDDQPIELRIDGTVLTFDSKMPVSSFLRPDADIVVSEESTRYMSNAERFQRANALLGIAAQFGNQFPAAQGKALEMVLRAAGIKDVSGWLEPPTTQPGGIGLDPNAAAADAGVSMQ